MADFPALPLWTDAYLADTMHMSVMESGAYLHLLMAAWRSPECSLPDDEKMLGRMARCTPREWSKVRDVVMNFWTHDEKTKTWSQKRLLKEREYVRDKSEKAKRAANAKYQKPNDTTHANASNEQPPWQPPSISPPPAPDMPPIPIPTITTTAIARDPACELIEAFDQARTRIFGEPQARPWPDATDSTTARKWIALGVDLGFCREVLGPRMQAMKAKGREPPATLSYFDKPMANAVAAKNQPMPQGNLNDDPLHIPDRFKRGPTKTDRAKAAVMRAAIAGGYAGEQSSGAAGAGDDGLSVFPVAEVIREGAGGA